MNLEVVLHITQMNPSQTSMSKEDSSHLKQSIWLHSHNNSHCPRKAVKRTPSSTDQDMTEKGVPKAILQGQQMKYHKDQPLQHPQHKLEDHHRLPQSPIQTESTRIHQNAMTRAPASGKGPGATKSKKKASEPHLGTVASTGPATQPSDSSKNTIICSGCGESGHWSRNCPYYNFCDFCRVTTYSTHMCRVTNTDPDHQSAYTAAKLTTVLLIVDTGLGTTGKNLDIHQTH